MKKVIAALAAALIFLMPVSADTGSADTVTPPASETPAVDGADTDKEASAEKRLGGVLLVSSVCGAMVIAALIWRGRDKTKYL